MNKKLLLSTIVLTLFSFNLGATTFIEIMDFINSDDYKTLTQDTKDEKLTSLIEQCNVADINAQDKYGDTLLHKIAEMGNAKIMELLLSKGANVHLKGSGNYAPLHCATTPECVQILVNHGANIHALSNGKGTPLHCSAILQHPKSVKILIEHGADVNSKDEFGGTPLHNVTSPKAAKLLIKNGADVHAKTWKGDAGQTPLHRAAGWITHKDPKLQARNKKLIKVLLENGALEDINVQDKKGRTPLHLAFSYKNARILINHGADMNICENEYGTPLHSAVKLKWHKRAKVLLECGANRYAVCRHEQSKIGLMTPLKLAKSQRKHEEGYIRINKKTRDLFRSKKKKDL